MVCQSLHPRRPFVNSFITLHQLLHRLRLDEIVLRQIHVAPCLRQEVVFQAHAESLLPIEQQTRFNSGFRVYATTLSERLEALCELASAWLEAEAEAEVELELLFLALPSAALVSACWISS